MDRITGNVSNNSDGRGSSWQYQDIINNGGMNRTMQSGQNAYNDVIGNGGYNDAMKYAQNMTGQIAENGGYNDAQRAALGNTQTLANSQYSISPELQKVLDAQASKVSDSVNENAAGAGRYGSGSNQTLLAKNVGDLTNSTVYNDYNNFLGRRDAANQNLFGMGQTGQSNVMGALSNVGNIGQNALGNYQNAAAGLANLGQNAVGNIGTAYQGLQAPAQSLMQVGGMNEDLATRQMNDQLRIFNDQQNVPWQNLSRLNAIASGAGSLGSTSTTSQPGQNPFLTALGYGSTGLGLLGML
jgi:hypothetical protein